ncbi:PorP/SprF family type IX secretion system membrane protein [Candidatus Amoebophilus asiaticus]|nr:PorP/SprF family type IX secretion system membrane protein [Candidatus Amoebophilus asiaticus]
MMFYFRTLTLTFLIAFSFRLDAQDIHWSQFYNSPLNLNPSLTGLAIGDMRWAVNYRDQWTSVMGANAFKTASFSFDMQIMKDKLGTDMAGAGLVILSDGLGKGSISSLKIMLSGSYHKSLSTYKKHYIAIGYQAGIIQKRLNITGLSFPSQWDGTSYNASLPTGENVGNTTKIIPDFQFGLLWYFYPIEQTSLLAGLTVFHILSPNESLLGQKSKIPRRYVFHGATNIYTNFNVTFIPRVILMLEGTANEVIAQTSIRYDFEDYLASYGGILIGGGYRFGDAFIVSAGVEFKNFTIEYSYDINVSELRAASNGRGGNEFSLIYVIPAPTRASAITCPRF